MTFFIWLLLTLPHDRLVCDLWIAEPPTQAALIQTCGTDALGEYRIDVLENGIGICSRPGGDLLFVADWCNLYYPLDHYRLRIVEPDYQDLIGCTVKTLTAEQPSARVIREQCPEAVDYEVRAGGTRQVKPEADPVCKPPSTPQPASIATSHELYLLAGKLIWYGYAQAACPGGLSGVDPETFAATPCGMDGARAQMIAWQNSLDDAILKAAREWNVPAEMLKELIERETQYWSWTGVDGEHGLIQITDDGAAVVLHVYEKGYYQMPPNAQYQARAAWLASLDCYYCSPRQTIEKAARDMSKYAQSLAAYYCMYGSWENALAKWNINYQ